MAYRITYLPKAEKAIAKLPRHVQTRVLEQIAKLSDDPRPNGSIKLTDSVLYRLRSETIAFCIRSMMES